MQKFVLDFEFLVVYKLAFSPHSRRYLLCLSWLCFPVDFLLIPPAPRLIANKFVSVCVERSRARFLEYALQEKRIFLTGVEELQCALEYT